MELKLYSWNILFGVRYEVILIETKQRFCVKFTLYLVYVSI